MQPDLEKLADRDEEHGISRFFEVKTVLVVSGSAITPLKRGVNEMAQRRFIIQTQLQAPCPHV